MLLRTGRLPASSNSHCIESASDACVETLSTNQDFVTPQEAGHATRDGTRAHVNVSTTASIPSPGSPCSVCVATLFFNRLPKAEVGTRIALQLGQANGRQRRELEMSTTSETTLHSLELASRADRAGERTDQTLIGMDFDTSREKCQIFDTFSRNCNLTKAKPSTSNQLLWSRLMCVFGRRRAVASGCGRRPELPTSNLKTHEIRPPDANAFKASTATTDRYECLLCDRGRTAARGVRQAHRNPTRGPPPFWVTSAQNSYNRCSALRVDNSRRG
jgi:hypothetical protein